MTMGEWLLLLGGSFGAIGIFSLYGIRKKRSAHCINMAHSILSKQEPFVHEETLQDKEHILAQEHALPKKLFDKVLLVLETRENIIKIQSYGSKKMKKRRVFNLETKDI